MKAHGKGILFGLGSSFTNSTFTVYTKYLMQFINQIALMPLWFMSAAAVLFLTALCSRRKVLFSELRAHWKGGVIIGLTNTFAAALFFSSVKIIGPSPTAFLARFDVVFIVILGFLFLREKLNYNELVGVIIAVSGAFVFAFSSAQLTLNAYIGILAALALAVNTLFARFYTQNVPILVLQLYRTAISAFAFLVVALAAGQFVIPEPKLILLIMLGSLITAVIGVGLYYSALKRIKTAFAAIIRNLDPFFVAVYAYFIFHTFPTLREWVGGIIILVGVTITILAMNSNYNKIYKKTGETQTLDA